jgi:hypothetical protein
MTAPLTLDELTARILARDLAHPRADLTTETADILAAEHDEREARLVGDLTDDGR